MPLFLFFYFLPLYSKCNVLLSFIDFIKEAISISLIRCCDTCNRMYKSRVTRGQKALNWKERMWVSVAFLELSNSKIPGNQCM